MASKYESKSLWQVEIDGQVVDKVVDLDTAQNLVRTAGQGSSVVVQAYHAGSPSVHLGAARYHLAWHCPNPPEALQEAAEEAGARDIIEYIRDHAEMVEPEEFLAAIGGVDALIGEWWGGWPASLPTDYEGVVEVLRADAEHGPYGGLFKSQYPDGTSIYFHRASGIEHVYEGPRTSRVTASHKVATPRWKTFDDPEVQQTVGENSLASLVYHTQTRGDVFFSMTEIEKLGVNPQSGFDTPLGIYAYPMSLGEILLSGSLPFATDRPYVNVFSVDMSRVVDTDSFSYDDLEDALAKLRQMYPPEIITIQARKAERLFISSEISSMTWESNGHGQVVAQRTKKGFTFLGGDGNSVEFTVMECVHIQSSAFSAEEYNRLVETGYFKDNPNHALSWSPIVSTQITLMKDHENLIQRARTTTKDRRPFGQFWNVTRLLAEKIQSKGSRSATWSHILSKFFDGVVDRGFGLIHDNEPEQAVFFSRKVIKDLGRFDNPLKASRKRVRDRETSKVFNYAIDRLQTHGDARRFCLNFASIQSRNSWDVYSEFLVNNWNRLSAPARDSLRFWAQKYDIVDALLKRAKAHLRYRQTANADQRLEQLAAFLRAQPRSKRQQKKTSESTRESIVIGASRRVAAPRWKTFDDPEVQQTVGENSLASLVYRTEGRGDVFFSMTEIEKLGVNPQSQYSTPLGIYAYPMGTLGQDLLNGSLPFAATRPYVNVFSVDMSRVIDVETFSQADLDEALNKLRAMYGSVQDQKTAPIHSSIKLTSRIKWTSVGYGEVEAERVSDNLHYNVHTNVGTFTVDKYTILDSITGSAFSPDELARVEQKGTKSDILEAKLRAEPHSTVYMKTPVDDLIDQAILDTRDTSPFGKFWNVTRWLASHVSKSTPALTWNTILSKFFDGVVDRGTSLIHPNEPAQAVFFSRRVINDLGRFDNPIRPKQQIRPSITERRDYAINRLVENEDGRRFCLNFAQLAEDSYSREKYIAQLIVVWPSLSTKAKNSLMRWVEKYAIANDMLREVQAKLKDYNKLKAYKSEPHLMEINLMRWIEKYVANGMPKKEVQDKLKAYKLEPRLMEIEAWLSDTLKGVK